MDLAKERKLKNIKRERERKKKREKKKRSARERERISAFEQRLVLKSMLMIKNRFFISSLYRREG